MDIQSLLYYIHTTHKKTLNGTARTARQNKEGFLIDIRFLVSTKMFHCIILLLVYT